MTLRGKRHALETTRRATPRLPPAMLPVRARGDDPAPDVSAGAPPPPVETVHFETGNPGAAAVVRGALDLAPVSGERAMLCVESVPGLMTSADFCVFVRPFADALRHFRLLRPASERNRYMVVLQLASPADAAHFARVFEGKHYLHGLVQETCRIREVRDVRPFSHAHVPASSSAAGAAGSETSPTDEAGAGSDPFPQAALFPRAVAPEDEAGDGAKVPSTSQSSACAVCLERLEPATAALVTTLCNHTMHAACLAQWDLNRCPVCRHTHELTPEASSCMNCSHRNDLWMCVVCGYVGCGVYRSKHAHQHFDETQHPFAMNLEDITFWSGEKIKSGSVWDYISERFVNRLLTSDDGKIVELGGARETRGNGAGAAAQNSDREVCCGLQDARAVDAFDEENERGFQAAIYASRMDAMVDEYRARIERMEAEHASQVADMEGSMERLTCTVSAKEAEIEQLKGARIEATKERKMLGRKLGEAEKENKSLQDKNGFLKNLNESLLRDKSAWNEQVETLTRKLMESESARGAVEEQLRDVMTHLEAQTKIVGGADGCRAGASELCGGDVLRVGLSPRERMASKTHRR